MIQQVRSWYGLPAEIAVENNLWPLVSVGGISLNHPLVVNLILRRELPKDERMRLSFFHEFGHLQTLPVAIFHLLILIFSSKRKIRSMNDFIRVLCIGLITHEAVWELAGETYVVARTGRNYKRIYQKYPNHIGQVVFWGGMVSTATLFTLLLFQRR